jgi:hypothetical protein
MRKLWNRLIITLIVLICTFNVALLYNQVFRKYPPSFQVVDWKVVEETKTPVGLTQSITLTFYEKVNISKECFGVLNFIMTDQNGVIVNTRTTPATKFNIGNNQVRELHIQFNGPFSPGTYTLQTVREAFCQTSNESVSLPPIEIDIS